MILLETIEALGRRGQTVNVSRGYARNFLIPKKKAIAATPGNLKKVESLRAHLVQEEEQRMGTLRDMAARLNAVSITIEAKASAEHHLYGSVTASHIRQALAEEGFELEERSIRLAEPLKELGVYTVPVRLHPDVATEVKVWVVEEKTEEAG
ncbi:MAG: 50S ribosomal protein L9 [Planctomycetota bacterium]